MPFHAFVTPANWVGLFPIARSFIYADGDLTGGNVVLDVQFSGMVREKGSNRLDNPTLYNYPGIGPDVGPDPANRRWFGQKWGVIGGQMYLSDTIGSSPILNIANNGYSHNDIAVDITTSSGQAGICSHTNGDQQFFAVYLDMAALRVKAATRDGPYGMPVTFTGTTVLTAGHTYRFRVAEATNGNISVYLDGVLSETFTIPAFPSGTDMTGVSGVGMYTSTTSARFANFYVAPTTALPAATNYAVRNYDGDIIYSGPFSGLADPTKLTIPDSSLKQRSNRGPYGWYRVNLTGPDRGDGQYNDSYGDTSFCRIPPKPGFPANGKISEVFNSAGVDDIGRGVMGFGPGRYFLSSVADPVARGNINAGTYAAAPVQKAYWADYATSLRPRRVLGAFADGTEGLETSVVIPTLQATPAIRAWETRNEPNYHGGPDTFVNSELIPFYNTVKGYDPTLLVLAPGVVSFNDGLLYWYDRFFQIGGHNYTDGISVHAYNCFNGDTYLARHCLSNFKALMTSYGVNKPLYQTEQGFGWEYAGLVYPRWANRWTAHFFFLCELYGLPVENNAYWYDTPLGFDTFPFYWTGLGHGIGPMPVPIRTMVAEVGDRVCTSQFDFGTYGNNLYAGGTWVGADGSKTVGFIASSYGAIDLTLDVTGTSTLTCSDPWGNTFTINVVNGKTSFPISELPQWIRCPVGVTISPTSLGLTTNVALTATCTSDGVCHVGEQSPGVTYTMGSTLNAALINNDLHENQSAGLGVPYRIVSPVLPFTITLTWSAPVNVNRVVVHAFPPFQVNGVPMAFTIDTWDGASWTTRYTKTRPAPKSFPFTGATTRCTWETYWDEQWIFDAQFATVPTSKIRMVISDGSYASGEIVGPYTALWGEFYGGVVPIIEVREIQAFDTSGAPPPPAGPVLRLRNPGMGGVI